MCQCSSYTVSLWKGRFEEPDSLLLVQLSPGTELGLLCYQNHVCNMGSL